MNTHEQTRSRVGMEGLAAGALALGMIWLAGCSTTGYKQGDRAAESAQTAALAVQTESQTLASTVTALNALVEKPAADLKPQFNNFNSALDQLVTAAKHAEAARKRLVSNYTAYFSAWTKQLTTITNADVRSESQSRKTEVSNKFDAANKSYQQSQTALRSLVDYLQDIRKALSVDLTASGLESAKPLVSNANTTAGKVKPDLEQAGTDLRALSAQMSSARGAVVTPPGS
jgi:hypothetical protein